MIVSYDTIIYSMRPPFQITPKILSLVAQISTSLGQLQGVSATKPPLVLCRQNRIKTIRNSLAIEGNTLTEGQITALMDGKRVLGPKKEIQEVLNAIQVYDQLNQFKPYATKSFLSAHKILMQELVQSSGKWRGVNVGVLKGNQVAHTAPKYTLVPGHMDNLFKYLKNDRETPLLVKSCVAHYEIEFIHPFEDGNGRMGRLWQTRLLMEEHPLFEFIPVEVFIKNRQEEYYEALSQSDKLGEATPFIEFSLEALKEAVNDFSKVVTFETQTVESRLEKAKEFFGKKSFSRKSYREVFKDISTATASRDLKEAVDKKILSKKGDQATTVYGFK